tara:strand:+ start:619 stop:1710 length:1092 start_codon:yes stop_codon:yes gene_type:complete
MKRKIILGFLIVGVFFALTFFIKSNNKELIDFETDSPYIAAIENKIVATGKVVPKDEVEIKPQITGIIDEIFIKEGEEVITGDLLARIKVVPDEQTLNTAKGRVQNAKIILNNSKTEFNRNKNLFSKGIISEQEYNSYELRYNQAKQDLANAQSDLKIIRLGSSGGSNIANTNIRATVTGTVLEIPVKKGDQIIQANTFNSGTTIARIADLNIMMFEGKVDEAEVSKLKQNMSLIVTLAAIENKEYDAKLKFIAPKGTDAHGSVQFKIKAEVYLDNEYFVRAGYSANAKIITEKKDSVLAINESLIQYNNATQKTYVEVEIGEQKFEEKEVVIGISDGINAEIISGVSLDDKIKLWNKTKEIN